MAEIGGSRRTWDRGLRVVAASCAMAASVAATEGSAAADGFHYVDRDGVDHQVDVTAAPQPPPAAAVAAPQAEKYPFAAVIQEAAGVYSLPVELLLAVITIESGFDPRVVSPRGAMGLMQVMPGTASEMKIADVFDPRDNILGGARYLRILLNGSGGDVVVALGAYHAGAGATQRYGGVPPYRDTHDYVASVVRFFRIYKARGPAFAVSVLASIRGKKRVSAPLDVTPAPKAPAGEPGAVAPREAPASGGAAPAPGDRQPRRRRVASRRQPGT